MKINLGLGAMEFQDILHMYEGFHENCHIISRQFGQKQSLPSECKPLMYSYKHGLKLTQHVSIYLFAIQKLYQ